MTGEKAFGERLLDWALPLPGPKELGKADCDALQMRDLGAEPGAYTWEDWYEEMQRDHPVSWWLRREFPRPFFRVSGKIDAAWYWLKCHTMRKHRYHILDLRKPGGGETWTYGWRDRRDVMLFASFKLLVDFVEREKPADPRDFGDRGLDTEHQQEDVARFEEMMSLYRWWKEGRAANWDKSTALYHKSHSKEEMEETAREALKDEWLAHHRTTEADDQRYFLRLAAIREYLWT